MLAPSWATNLCSLVNTFRSVAGLVTVMPARVIPSSASVYSRLTSPIVAARRHELHSNGNARSGFNYTSLSSLKGR